MKLLQLPNPGNGGRLGNQLFTIASTIGLALRFGYTPRIPADWKYREYFNIPDKWFGEMEAGQNIIERSFEHDLHLEASLKMATGNVNLHGYFQSHKYWQGYEHEIRKYLTPKGCTTGTLNKIAIHYRRGDYIGNKNYVTLPIAHQLPFLSQDYTAFSDDENFLKLHHPNNYFHESEMEDFKQMIRHYHHICSNSTFSWWAAYLSGGNVYRPTQYFAGDLAKRCSTVDFWPDEWAHLNVEKMPIKATFIIPVMFDHPDRLANCITVCAFLSEHFDCEILIGEINGNHFGNIQNTKHVTFQMPHFHRTKVLNELTKMAGNDIVFNWDADVICSPISIIESYYALLQGNDISYPYNGTFYWMPRTEIVNCKGDLTGLVGKRFRAVGASPTDNNSYGGAVGYNRAAFFAAGGENENHISYSNEDQERWWRFNTLGLKIHRASGALYHIDHYRGKDSTMSHRHGRNNMQEWEKEKRMSKEELINYINTWAWVK